LEQARALAVTLDDGAGVIVLTDMVGGTPANIATHLVKAGSIEGVAGVNLPMLMRTLTYRCNPLSTVVAKAVSGGTECVATLTRGERHVAG
jgi:PTS system ascorbate-specific IIA component